jgi:hypothetical protein
MGKSQCINATATQRIAMFQLAQSIESWKKQFYYRKGISPWDIYELSQHLEEEIALHQAKGLSDEIAFQLATEHLGKPELIENEYSKLDRSKKNGISLAVVAKIIFNIVRQHKYIILLFWALLSGIFAFQWRIYHFYIINPTIESLRFILLIISFVVVGVFSFFMLSWVQLKKTPSLLLLLRSLLPIILFIVVDYLITLTNVLFSFFWIIPGVWFYSRFFLAPWLILDKPSSIKASLRESYWLTSAQPFIWLFFSLIFTLMNFFVVALWIMIMHNQYQLFYQTFYLLFKAIVIAVIYNYLTTVVPLERS